VSSKLVSVVSSSSQGAYPMQPAPSGASSGVFIPTFMFYSKQVQRIIDAMHSYRCFFLSSRAALTAVEIIEAESDEEAMRRAEAAFRETGAHAPPTDRGTKR
jgi:hypothetical protein